MRGEQFALVESYRVGRYVVTWSVPKGSKGDVVACAIEWDPPRTTVLTAKEIAQFRMGKARVYAKLARVTGQVVSNADGPPKLAPCASGTLCTDVRH